MPKIIVIKHYNGNVLTTSIGFYSHITCEGIEIYTTIRENMYKDLIKIPMEKVNSIEFLPYSGGTRLFNGIEKT